MNRELGFETIPFEIDPEFERDFKGEDEWGRRRSFARGRAGMHSRPHSMSGQQPQRQAAPPLAQAQGR